MGTIVSYGGTNERGKGQFTASGFFLAVCKEVARLNITRSFR